jgi:FkbM family methyltransferase
MYSQGKEEPFIINFFKDRIGTLLDVGANDGKSLSNSLRLIELGWTGILIEASPKAFARLQETHKYRNNVYLFNLALTDHDGEGELNESGAIKAGKCNRDNVGLVSSLDEKWMKPWGKTHFDKIKVPCRSWKTFLEESPIKKFDFITIDIEGEDAKLLEQIDLKEIGCELLCIEYIYPEMITILTEICENKGYKEVGRTKTNLLFAKNENKQ